MSRVCRHGFVSGRVQGVWYRGSTQAEARRLGIDGWARNLPDGRVEVLFCGEAVAVAALEAWLQQGPPAARVDEVLVTDHEDPGVSGFTTG